MVLVLSGELPVDALLRAQRADYTNLVTPNSAKRQLVTHWALPAVDAVAAEARAAAVQTAADEMSYLVSTLPSEIGGSDYVDIEREPVQPGPPSPAILEQRAHMVNVTNMLDGHDHSSYEGKLLLESVDDATVRQLDETLDALERASEDTSRASEISSKAMLMALEKMDDLVMRVGPWPLTKRLVFDATPETAPGATAASDAAQAPPGSALIGTSSASEPALPGGVGGEDELQEALDAAVATQGRLEHELGLSKTLLAKAHGQLLDAKKRTDEARMWQPGGRCAEGATQTEPEHHRSVFESLHEGLHERDRVIDMLHAELKHAYEIAGITRTRRFPVPLPVPPSVWSGEFEVDSSTTTSATAQTPERRRTSTGKKFLDRGAIEPKTKDASTMTRDAPTPAPAPAPAPAKPPNEDAALVRKLKEKHASEKRQLEQRATELEVKLQAATAAAQEAASRPALEPAVKELLDEEGGVNAVLALVGRAHASEVLLARKDREIVAKDRELVATWLDGMLARTADVVVAEAKMEAKMEAEVRRRVDRARSEQEREIGLKLTEAKAAAARAEAALQRQAFDGKVLSLSLAAADEELEASGEQLEETYERLDTALGRSRAHEEAEASGRQMHAQVAAHSREITAQALALSAVLLIELDRCDESLGAAHARASSLAEEQAALAASSEEARVGRAAVDAERRQMLERVGAAEAKAEAMAARVKQLEAAAQVAQAAQAAAQAVVVAAGQSQQHELVLARTLTAALAELEAECESYQQATDGALALCATHDKAAAEALAVAQVVSKEAHTKAAAARLVSTAHRSMAQSLRGAAGAQAGANADAAAAIVAAAVAAEGHTIALAALGAEVRKLEAALSDTHAKLWALKLRANIGSVIIKRQREEACGDGGGGGGEQSWTRDAKGELPPELLSRGVLAEASSAVDEDDDASELVAAPLASSGHPGSSSVASRPPVPSTWAQASGRCPLQQAAPLFAGDEESFGQPTWLRKPTSAGGGSSRAAGGRRDGSRPYLSPKTVPWEPPQAMTDAERDAERDAPPSARRPMSAATALAQARVSGRLSSLHGSASAPALPSGGGGSSHDGSPLRDHELDEARRASSLPTVVGERPQGPSQRPRTAALDSSTLSVRTTILEAAMERKLESEWGRKHSELLFKMSAARHASKAYEESTAARSGLAHPSSRRAASAGPHSGGSTGVAAAAAVAAAAHRASMPMPERRLRRPATAAPEVALPQPHAAVQAPPPPPPPPPSRPGSGSLHGRSAHVTPIQTSSSASALPAVRTPSSLGDTRRAILRSGSGVVAYSAAPRV